jgi:hypothetical protein
MGGAFFLYYIAHKAFSEIFLSPLYSPRGKMYFTYKIAKGHITNPKGTFRGAF